MLSIVSTPIGNLGDVSLRALEALRSADLIACEDTRTTAKLLARHDIRAPLTSFHEHNERAKAASLADMIAAGKHVVLVSDAGTPGISDPGYRLIHEVIARGLPMTTMPGPAAFVSALILSGLPVHAFTFRGFPPRKSGQRRRFVAMDAASPHTLVFYESPHRLLPFLDDALAVLGDRPAAVVKEITKLHERVYRGTLSAILQALTGSALQGEFCVVVGGADDARDPAPVEPL